MELPAHFTAGEIVKAIEPRLAKADELAKEAEADLDAERKKLSYRLGVCPRLGTMFRLSFLTQRAQWYRDVMSAMSKLPPDTKIVLGVDEINKIFGDEG